MRRGILKVVDREDKSRLLPTGAAVSIEDVEVRKEDGQLKGWGHYAIASPWREEVQVRSLMMLGTDKRGSGYVFLTRLQVQVSPSPSSGRLAS